MSILSLIPFQFSALQWASLLLSCVCFGISKTGLSNISIIAVPLFALAFGAKSSTGVVLPLLCFADLFAVLYYRRHAAWNYVVRLVPWAIAGFALALAADKFITSDRGFKMLIGICILAGLVVLLWTDLIAPKLKKKNNDEGESLPPGSEGLQANASPPPPSAGAVSAQSGESIPSAPAKKAGLSAQAGAWYSALFGILGGFSTMIGNTAGPVMSVFLLSVKLPKESFVGTAAWFFLIVNYLKLPLQIFAWHNITRDTLVFDLFMLPFVLLGVWLGIVFVKKVSDRQYRLAVYALTVAASVLLLV